jgi:hypothetical protein
LREDAIEAVRNRSDVSGLEPDGDERKYYAPGIGDFLEIEVSTGNVTQLVDCNVDPRCAMLPEP